MLGRATRAVEMTRGGREGNNAFLKYESAAGSSFGGVEALIESGIGYKDIVKLSKEPNIDSLFVMPRGLNFLADFEVEQSK
ncbi:unnamed protein product [Haemonchus placei]|uniref:Prohibitin n=1 Tax=Haemonchus placei TaxID=6290 RepID=A0A0N4VZA8_HAEPC|nr:unnamed protein product [Haemonchus placei]